MQNRKTIVTKVSKRKYRKYSDVVGAEIKLHKGAIALLCSHYCKMDNTLLRWEKDLSLFSLY